jgi:hypothetical protein
MRVLLITRFMLSGLFIKAARHGKLPVAQQCTDEAIIAFAKVYSKRIRIARVG